MQIDATLVIDVAEYKAVISEDVDDAWDTTGWLQGTTGQPLFQHRQGRRVLQEHGVPVISNLAELRKRMAKAMELTKPADREILCMRFL